MEEKNPKLIKDCETYRPAQLFLAKHWENIVGKQLIYFSYSLLSIH